MEDEPGEPLTLEEKLARDPVGNGVAIVVLAGMVIILIMAAWVLRRPTSRRPSTGHKWAFALLWLVGFGVAGYMAYVETAQVSAVCGPVGDCNTVQQSEYARLFGVLPIGVIGLFGYGAIFLAWVISNVQHKRLSELATLALAAMTFFGTLFSIYLTFLEPFVIGATCVWCLTSAVVMTALFVLSIPYFRSRWSHILTNT